MNNQPGTNHPQRHPLAGILWLLVGLAPIPILLLVGSMRGNSTFYPGIFFLCAFCSLCGGIGCLGFIKNVAVRIILGLFLAAGFFVLSLIIAIFQACSGSGGFH